ncbi:MAG: hypothetical protein ACRDS0_25605 [Pseudonocardiaceae bacterium]
MTLYTRIPHPRIKRRQAAGPATVDAQYDRATPIARFNSALAVVITTGVGSMWCAYAFAVLTLFGLPGAIAAGVSGVVQWIAQTFLQLVLLSIILVGQNVQAAASDKRALDTFVDAEAILHEVAQIHAHLLEQDKALLAQQDLLAQLRDRLGGTPPRQGEDPELTDAPL